MTPLSPHFAIEEFLKAGMASDQCPADVRANLETLAVTVLEPVRAAFGQPVLITSGYRPYAYNLAIGGAKDSDHVYGRAADFHIGDGIHPWEVNTLNAFHLIRTNLDGAYGQLILEDHRVHLSNPAKLWVHVAIPGPKHGGFSGDPNRILVSKSPKSYVPWKDGMA